MLKEISKTFEAVLWALLYFFVLLIGLAVAVLGAYIVIFLSYRTGQFLFELIFREKWL